MAKAGAKRKLTGEKLNTLKQLARMQCTTREIAAALDISPSILSKNKEYSTIIAEGKEFGKMSLRRKQFEVAMKGNVTMLLWLGKQYLGQAETFDVSVSNDDSGFSFFEEPSK